MAEQEELILKQFSAARQKLGQQQKAQQQDVEQQLNRRTAMTAMTGGAATKSLQKAQKGIAEGFGSAEADLAANEAKALQGVQAEKEARQFQTSERLGTQEYGSEEAQKQRAETARQFNANYGLQNAQFQAAQDQFNQQMDFTYREFNENQKANLLNSFIAIDQAQLSGQDVWWTIESYRNVMQREMLKTGELGYDGIQRTTVKAPELVVGG